MGLLPLCEARSLWPDLSEAHAILCIAFMSHIDTLQVCFPPASLLHSPGGNARPRGISTDPRSLGEPVWGDGDTLGRPGRCFCEPDKDTFSLGMVEQLLGHPSAISTQVDGEKGKQLALNHFFF